MLLVKYKLFGFNDPDNNQGFKIDKPTFLEYMKSEDFQRRLRKRICYGVNSHEARDLFEEYECPSVGSQEDMILSKGLASNTLITLEVVGEDVIAEMLVFDNVPGTEVQLHLGAGVDMEVSMSIYSKVANEKYFITRLSGVDFTTNGAFKTQLLSSTPV